MDAIKTSVAQSAPEDVQVDDDAVLAKIDVEISESGPKSFVRRTAKIDGIGDEIEFGTHGPFRKHYGVELGEFPEEQTTNEVFAAALASCMTGSYAAVLGARGIDLTNETLKAEAYVDMGPAADDGLYIIRSVHLYLTATVAEEDRPTAERLHDIYHKECWLSQTLRGSRCEISSTLSFA